MYEICPVLEFIFGDQRLPAPAPVQWIQRLKHIADVRALRKAPGEWKASFEKKGRVTEIALKGQRLWKNKQMMKESTKQPCYNYMPKLWSFWRVPCLCLDIKYFI